MSRYELTKEYAENDKVKPGIFTDLEIDLAEIFEVALLGFDFNYRNVELTIFFLSLNFGKVSGFDYIQEKNVDKK